MKLTRRAFLAAAGVFAAGGHVAIRSAPPAVQPKSPLYDLHVHLFGVGDGGTGCFASPKQRSHWNFALFLRLLGLEENGRMDQEYVAELVRQLTTSSIDKAVLVAQDARYDRNGKLDLHSTNFYTPNEYLFEVVNRHPKLFVACGSINPKRRDALDELERCAEKGARLIKVHPSTQGVDPAEARFRPFYRRLRELDMLLMVHTGMEHSSEVVGHDVARPSRLVTALDEGCTVIASHAGMGAFFDPEDFFPELVGMVSRYPRLYCDSAVLASMFRWRNLPRILDEPTVLERLVHGSDWPFPSNALVFWNRLSPGRLLDLCTQRNLFERDFRLKQAIGLPIESFERGSLLLEV